MNESQRIEVENRELFLIGQNTLARYEREQGIAEGEISGILKGKLEVAEKMARRGTPIQYIIEDTGLSEETIRENVSFGI